MPSHEEIHTTYEQGEEVIVALFEETLSKLVDRIQALEDQIANRDVYGRGIETVTGDIVAQLSDVEAVYFTSDIDDLDPAYAPGTGTPEAGGLSTR